METYYNPEDLAKFGTIGEKASELAEIMLAKIIEDYDYSESEIDNWNDEMSSFRNSRPKIPYEYQNNSGELGFSYNPAYNEFNFWSRKKDVVDIYIKNIEVQ